MITTKTYDRTEARQDEQAAEPLALRLSDQLDAGARTALELFKECGGHEENDPVERLRFFCSLAMSGQDWLDVEPFFDDVLAERASACGLTECRGKPMCVRCERIADMDALCQLLPEGVAWGDPLTPELLRAVLVNPRPVEFRRLYADW